MAVPDPTPPPAFLADSPDARLVWTAGFLDGEGCFYSRPRGGAVLLVQVVQVQRAPLDWLYAWWGGNLFHPYPPSRRRPNQQPIWRWDLHGFAAENLMERLYPLLSPRRQQQVQTALALWRNRQLHPRDWITCRFGHPLVPNPNGVGRGCPKCDRRGEEARRGRWGRRHRGGAQESLPL
jgi:hypothetical protein